MLRISYSYDDTMTGQHVTHTTTYDDEDSTITWVQMLSDFQNFVAGCGYIIDRTKVDFAEICEYEHGKVIEKKLKKSKGE